MAMGVRSGKFQNFVPMLVELARVVYRLLIKTFFTFEVKVIIRLERNYGGRNVV